MLLGRRRRYFGYPHNVEGFVDTPESAKSYASCISPVVGQTRTRIHHGQCFKPDKPLPKRFADKYLHAAIEAQIPALLPPLRNTFRFKEYEKNPMKFHPPQLENHFERTLYYIWLSKNDRQELCNIVDAHLGSRVKGSTRHGEYQSVGNPMQRFPKPDFSQIPRTLSLLDDELPTPKKGKSKPQKGIWDTPKTPRDRFVRDHGRSRAMDAICHIYPGNELSRVTEKDINECILAAKLLLGPYAGINTQFTSPNDIPPEILEMIEEEDQLQRQKGNEQKEVVSIKRPFGYNSNQLKYEKKIAAAMEYYNNLNSGMPHAEPSAELFKDTEYDIGRSQENPSFENLPKSNIPQKSQTNARRRKFNKDNITEDDYMDMYVHYLGSHEDLSIKNPTRSLTDISKLRKKMHIDQNSDEEGEEAAIAELLRSDSLSDIKDPVARRIIKGEIHPQNISRMKREDKEILKTIIDGRSERTSFPKMKTILEQYSVQTLDKSSSVTVSPASSTTLSDTKIDTQKIEEETVERALGFLDGDFETLVNDVKLPEKETSAMDISIVTSSDTDVSSQFPAVEQIPLGESCSAMDLKCLSEHGVLGIPAFKSSRVKTLITHEDKDPNEEIIEQMPEMNVFAKEHWAKRVQRGDLH